MGTPLSFGLVANTLQEHRWFFNCKSTSEVRHTTHLYARSLKNIKQRQKEGIEAAKIRGVKFGRPECELPDNFEEVFWQWCNGNISGTEAAKKCGLPTTSFYRKANKKKSEIM